MSSKNKIKQIQNKEKKNEKLRFSIRIISVVKFEKETKLDFVWERFRRNDGAFEEGRSGTK